LCKKEKVVCLDLPSGEDSSPTPSLGHIILVFGLMNDRVEIWLSREEEACREKREK
jgi:hypothetical protein